MTAVGRGELRQMGTTVRSTRPPARQGNRASALFLKQAELRRRSFGEAGADDANPVWPMRYLAIPTGTRMSTSVASNHRAWRGRRIVWHVIWC